MTNHSKPILSIVVPVYNEAAGIESFHKKLHEIAKQSLHDTFEIIYVDDGSEDRSGSIVGEIAATEPRVKLIRLSRNFGKENALTAGIFAATGKAILMLDGDGQHPIEIMPKFLDAWRDGARIVIGIRNSSAGIPWFKQLSSNVFHRLFNLVTGQKLIAGSTDYRLIDRAVQVEFLKLQESKRVTRGLIDWLGFDPVYIEFEASDRNSGSSTYGTKKLVELAANSLTSLSPKPLYMFGYLGVIITILTLILGLSVILEQIILNDPLGWNFTGTAMLAILILFLVGLILLSQGILSLYISHIHNLAQQRPLYVIDYDNSRGIPESRLK